MHPAIPHLIGAAAAVDHQIARFCARKLEAFPKTHSAKRKPKLGQRARADVASAKGKAHAQVRRGTQEVSEFDAASSGKDRGAQVPRPEAAR